jgi:hypothetical protein
VINEESRYELLPEDELYTAMVDRLEVSFSLPEPADTRFYFAQDLSRHSPPDVDAHARADATLPAHHLYWDDLSEPTIAE